jgi:hypothetical protein
MGEAKRKREVRMSEDKRKREVRAHHEAGHAVVARTLGLQIYDIRLANGDDYVQTSSEAWAAKDGTAEDRIAAYEKEAKTSMAGVIAQHQVSPLHPDEVRGQTADMTAIWDRLMRIALLRSGAAEPDLPPGERVILTDEQIHAAISIAEQLWAETQSTVKASWPAIEQVAGLMLGQDRTTQADVDCAMQSAGDGVTAVFNEPLPFASFVSSGPIEEDEPTT